MPGRSPKNGGRPFFKKYILKKCDAGHSNYVYISEKECKESMMQDERILEMLSQRDEGAIAAVSEKYRGYCFGIAKNILGSDLDSEECVSDAIFKAWTSIPPCPSDLRAYLAKLTRNTALDRWRMDRAACRNGQAESAAAELNECIPAWQRDEVFDEIALRDIINRFLGELSEEDRSLFIARYFRAEPIAEVAREHRMGESRVKMKLLRARKRLKEILNKENVRI